MSFVCFICFFVFFCDSVFDTVENNIREVLSSIPLGCEVGSGYMHTIPYASLCLSAFRDIVTDS